MHTHSLTPKGIRYMISVLNREVVACGVDTEAGRLADSMRVYLGTLLKPAKSRPTTPKTPTPKNHHA